MQQSGVPNFAGARLSLPTSLNISAWQRRLINYQDNIICNFLEFGWPVGYTKQTLPVTQVRNHNSALQFPDAVMDYINTEIALEALMGPFDTPPFSPVTSPLQTVPKKGTSKRRIVLDLSFPAGFSVNDGIPPNWYMGQPLQLTYPSVDDLAALIVQHGRGCHMFKADLKRAYRQLPVCPLDYALLGFSWQGHFYTDLRIPFGIRTGAMTCQGQPMQWLTCIRT